MLTVLLVQVALAASVHAYTDAYCAANYPASPYACNYYNDGTCPCGYGKQTSGSGWCCFYPASHKGCVGVGGDAHFTSCALTSQCYSGWQDVGSCSLCGAQTQVNPCVGDEGSAGDQYRTVSCSGGA